MTIEYLEHINIQTEKMESLIEYYEDVLGMHHGKRPDLAGLAHGFSWVIYQSFT